MVRKAHCVTLRSMLGAIAGDVVGSVHEYAGTKTKTFPLFVRHSNFTDDSVLTVAVADWILTNKDLIDTFHEYVRAYPGRGYGSMFGQWASTKSRNPYNSYGNGSAMRVSPVGFAFGTIEEVLDYAARSAAVTHDHSEAIRGPRQRRRQSSTREHITTRRSFMTSSHRSLATTSHGGSTTYVHNTASLRPATARCRRR